MITVNSQEYQYGGYTMLSMTDLTASNEFRMAASKSFLMDEDALLYILLEQSANKEKV